MDDTTSATHRAPAGQPGTRNGTAGAPLVLAAVLLVVSGTVSILQGIAALLTNDVFVVGDGYTFRLSLTGWGWIHLIVGIVAALTAFGLFGAAAWARMVALAIAALSIVANFMWLPYYPGWAISIIALDLVVITAVAMWKPNRH